MARTFFSLDDIDNTGTLYEEVISQIYPQEDWNRMLLNTQFLRTSILKLIKDFIDSEDIITIKEFSDAPPMVYDDPDHYDFGVPEIETDSIIIRKAFGLTKVRNVDAVTDEKYNFCLEALNTEVVHVDVWDKFLDSLYEEYVEPYHITDARVQKIIVEDPIDIFRTWNDTSNSLVKEMLKEYNRSYDVEYDYRTYWQEPFYHIAKKYWEKFSFAMTINDYEIYDPNNEDVLKVIEDRYFDNGYYDEIIIKMNYFYWYDDFERIVDWSSRILGSPMVSYRFDTLFSNDTKNRYYDEAEAEKYGDVQRKNTDEEEIQMFEERLPIFLEKILVNPQVLGFELDGGYFGREGYIPSMEFGDGGWELFTYMMCKILTISPFAQLHDHFKVYFDDPERLVYICVKGR